MSAPPNLNAFHAHLLVEELTRSGVTRFFVAPGSRSAPLVVAIASSRAARATLVVDERAAGYAAVGHGRADGNPAAVLTTSGTAAANLLPAIVEASLDRVPMIVLTADRPPELRDAGANQSIDQRRLFGSHVRWEHELPCPSDVSPARAVLTAVDHAVALARGPDPGPVHINCPYREPLAPDPDPWSERAVEGLERWSESDEPFTRTEDPEPSLPPERTAWLTAALAHDARGVVLVGGLPASVDRDAVCALVTRLGWPVIADARSGIRGGDVPAGLVSCLERVTSHEGIGPYRPDVVLQIGSRLTSKRLLALAEVAGCEWIVVDPSRARLDPSHRVTARIFARPDRFATAARDALGDRPPSNRGRSLAPLAHRVRAAIDSVLDAEADLTEPFAARHVTRHTPGGHGLYLSSSLPIREVDAFGADDGPRLHVASNRGASGIDGVIASAVGFTLAHGKPTTLLIGDLAFLHDANSLALVASQNVPLTIVLINNGGGGIFHFLPIARHDALLTPWFDTPQRVDFGRLAGAFDLPYVRCDDVPAFTRAYGDAVTTVAPRLVEVVTDVRKTHEIHERLDAAARAACRES